MPLSLLDLPYELREQILNLVLFTAGSVKLQRPEEGLPAYTPPILQVCRLLRDEAARVFYHVNTFMWAIDPEAKRLVDANLCPSPDDSANDNDAPRSSRLLWQQTSSLKSLRHLRLNIYLPDPYNRMLWQDDLASQLRQFVASVDNGDKLKNLKVLIMTWHCFRDLTDWHADVLNLLGRMTVRGFVEVRTRSLDAKLRAKLQRLDLTGRLRDSSVPRTMSAFDECSTVGCQDVDWGWEGGVVV